jgi:tetratricopeptide (TPR) repeat protein
MISQIRGRMTGIFLTTLPGSCICLLTLLLLCAPASGQVRSVPPASSTEQAEEAFSRGVQALKKGELAEAEKVFKEVLAVNATAAAHHNLGIVYQTQGKHQLAVGEFHKALQLDPGFSQARPLMGASLLALRRIPEAVRELEQSVQTFPDQPLLRMQLARAYLRAGDQVGVVRQYQELTQRDPQNPEYRYLLGQAYMKVAEWSHRRIRELNPQSPRLYQALAHTFLASGQLEQAAQALRLAIAFDPLLPDLNMTLANVYFQQGRLAEALQAVQAELRIVPENRGASELERMILAAGGTVR